MMLCGINITVSPDRPKMTLSEAVTVSPEFRAEINAWMLEFFGTWNLVPDGQMYQMPGMTLVNPRTYAALRQQTKGTP